MAKRARKYWLGVSTISQDVEDFLTNDYGKAIVSNSSIQFLMKQSSISIPMLVETFHLSQGERQLLLAVDVGEGIFFASQNHVALRIVASPEEHAVITTKPEELLKLKQQQQQQQLSGDQSEVALDPTVGDHQGPNLDELYGLINNLEYQDNQKDEVQAPSDPYSISSYRPPQ